MYNCISQNTIGKEWSKRQQGQDRVYGNAGTGEGGTETQHKGVDNSGTEDDTKEQEDEEEKPR